MKSCLWFRFQLLATEHERNIILLILYGDGIRVNITRSYAYYRPFVRRGRQLVNCVKAGLQIFADYL